MMAKWWEERTELRMEIRAYPVWARIIIAFFGLGFFFAACLGFLAGMTEGGLQAQYAAICHFLFSIGSAMCYVSLSKQSMMSNVDQVVFDDAENAVFISNRRMTAIRLDYDNLQRIQITREEPTPDSSARFHLYLMKKDGARFCLYSASASNKAPAPQTMLDAVQSMHKHTGLAVYQGMDMLLAAEDKARPAKVLSNEKAAPKTLDRARSFLHVQHSSEGDLLSLQNARLTPVQGFWILSILSLFLAAPIYLYAIYLDAEPPLIAYFLVFAFTILWYSVLFYMIAFALLRVGILLSANGLRLRLSWKGVPWLAKNLDIPRSAIQAVRANKNPNTYLSLSLCVGRNAGFAPDAMPFYMKRSISDANSALPEELGSGKEIWIWQLPASAGNDSPSYLDLLQAEEIIQGHLRLDESRTQS